MKNTAALKKAEELFRREAATLYQLEHPQIPRFWEIFRQDKQIFLVVDYIDGSTYKELLEQRLLQGQCFSETEILQFFQNLLPVLSYLHRRGVIHRDISPDNIILCNYDRLPVLIDMGGVKQVAIEVNALTAQLETQPNPNHTSLTCLGKVGYAPDEQIRIGLVAPNSDLYALAVTVLVLMTGKKPQQLLDQNTLQWMWAHELKLNPLLAKTINQMLAPKPAHRFQSAEEVLQVLTPLFSSALTKISPEQPESSLAIFSESSRQEQATPKPSQSTNRSRNLFTSLKRNWKAIPGAIKSLVLTGLVMSGGLVYFFWKNDSKVISKPTSTVVATVSDVQLLDSMQEVQNVPSGLFNYGGAHTFAALNSDPMKDAIARVHPELGLRYTEPLSGNPGSGTGIKMLIDGELSFAQSARPLEEEDYNKAKARGFAIEQVAIAIDGVVFYTHPELTIPGLSIDQLQGIFRGEVTNWQEVGGPNLPIVPVALDPKITSSLKLLLGGEGDDLGSNVQIVRDFTEAIRKVSGTVGGISYASAAIAKSQKSVRSIALAKANTKQYIQPFTENKQVNAPVFRDGTYPMTRRLFIVFRRDRSVDEEAAVAYINMLLSKEGQAIAEDVGYVPIR
jgi:phosphate transport system substrate-binding protein